jgi:hypothetical protein
MVKDTEAELLPGMAETAVGAPAVVIGITATDEGDAAPLPAALVAATVKV